MPTNTKLITANSVLKLQDNIPLPKKTRKGEFKYPLGSMNVGQSFCLAGESDIMVRKACQAILFYRRKTNDGRLFVVRSRKESQAKEINPLRETGARVWRVA